MGDINPMRSDGKLPVVIEIRIGAGAQVAIDHGQQPRDLVARRLMRTQPAVLLPLLKAHARHR